MIKNLITYFFLLGCNVLLAQQFRAPELPDEMRENLYKLEKGELVTSRLRGIAVDYKLSAPYTLTSNQPNSVTGRVNSEERFVFKYRIPVVLKDKWQLLLGHSFDYLFLHMSEDFSDENLLGEIDDLRLKANRFTIYSIHRIKPGHSFTAVASMAYNGAYDDFVNFNKQYQIFRGIVAYRRALDPNNGWAVGLYYKNGFRSSTFLPFATWNKTFNAKWGFEAILVTEFNLRYNHNKDNIFLMGYEYTSQDYSLNFDKPDGARYIYEFKWPKLNFSGKWHHRYTPMIWSVVEAGFQYNLDPATQVDNLPNFPEDEIDITSHGPMIRLGLFLTPPDKWLN